MRNNSRWIPQEKQKLALESKAFELFFGGARGGGKSDYLLADFTKNLSYGSAHRGVIFRRTNPELEELLRRAREIYPAMGAEWKEKDRTWTFPGGASLKLRYLERDQDVHRYQGHQYSWIAFDELTNWKSDAPYVYTLSCARSAEGVPVRVRSAGNPGSVGHAWVKGRFIDGKEPYKIYRCEETGLTQQFVPALLSDNKMLDEGDPEYRQRLELLPDHLKRAYLYGDWDIFAGQVFEEWRHDKHVTRPFAIPAEWQRWCSMDWGYAKPFSIGWWAKSGDGLMIRYREWYGCDKEKRNTGIKMSSTEVAKKAWELSAVDGVTTMVADPAVWSKVDDTPSIADIFGAAGFTMVKANNDRISGLQRMHDLMSTNGDDGKPMLRVFSSCLGFIRTIPLMVHDEKKPEDVDTEQEDHIYDEARYGIMHRVGRPTRTPHPFFRKRPKYDAFSF